ncbi:MAG: segregation/condensation protein A, partial [Aeromicrobium sp.]
KEGVVSFDQATPLGDLHIRWTGTNEGDIDVGEEFDNPDLAPDLALVADPETDIPAPPADDPPNDAAPNDGEK